MTLRDKAAAALDATHSCGECGPMTMKSRTIIATWLDGRSKIHKTTLRRLVDYLEMVAKRESA